MNAQHIDARSALLVPFSRFRFHSTYRAASRIVLHRCGRHGDDDSFCLRKQQILFCRVANGNDVCRSCCNRTSRICHSQSFFDWEQLQGSIEIDRTAGEQVAGERARQWWLPVAVGGTDITKAHAGFTRRAFEPRHFTRPDYSVRYIARAESLSRNSPPLSVR
jgi:hypothetical protein